MTIWQWAVLGAMLGLADHRATVLFSKVAKTPVYGEAVNFITAVFVVFFWSLLHACAFAFFGYLWNL